VDGARDGDRYDVLVIGGSIAGLSTAPVLGRSRRTLIPDARELRNALSPGVHSFFSRDGILPAELLRIVSSRASSGGYGTKILEEGAQDAGDG
jgi:thioredoxin reductase